MIRHTIFPVFCRALTAFIAATAGAAAQQDGSGSGKIVSSPLPEMFVGSNQCIACHNNLHTRRGLDVSIGSDWHSSMMAHSSADPYWQAAVRREIIEHPSAREAIEDECSKCHMPMARFRAHAGGGSGKIFEHLPLTGKQPAIGGAPATAGELAAEGVSCTTCHQILPDHLGQERSFTGGFQIDTRTPAGERSAFGPFEVDRGRRTVMQTASSFRPRRAAHIQDSALCATCHTLYTHTLGPDGETVGRLPEQVPYLEWRHSDYPGRQSCQDCHMPRLGETMEISSVLGRKRPDFSRHSFRGGNFFMLRILDEAREELGVTAPTEELQSTIGKTIHNLRNKSARLSIGSIERSDRQWSWQVRVANLAGHKLPTAYPSRRAWLHVTVRDAAGNTVFESGALQRDGSIAGNDNDADAARYEPHHATINSPDQVQIYEAIMATPEGEVTTGLLRAVRFIKDNRVLPSGFDKAAASPDIAARGAAATDGDFDAGGDTVHFAVELGGTAPYRVEAELWYQPVGFRWAYNLERFEATETRRFVRLYSAMSDHSAVMLAAAAADTGSQ